MKIAYVYYLIRKDQIGVETKIQMQARAARAADLQDFDILVLNLTRDFQDGNLRYVKLRPRSFLRGYYDLVFRKYWLIDNSTELKDYDVVLLRYPLADRTGHDFVRRYHVVSEHHTKEPLELSARLRASGSPFEKMTSIVLLMLERKYAASILHDCKGIVGVSDEVRDYQVARARGSLPSITIANGTEVENISHTGFKRFDGDKLDIVFLASFLRPWGGLQRLIKSFNNYQGNLRWTLHIVGDIRSSELAEFDLSNIRFHGTRSGSQFDAIMRDMNLAVSSLALYRKEISELSLLKTIEYTARGIPFILANNDPNLSDVSQERRFFLEIPNDDSMLNIDTILDFSRTVSMHQNEIMSDMRDYALKTMDLRVKLKQYDDFIRGL